MKRLALAVGLIFVLAGQALAHPAGQLWPLQAGNRWVYRVEGVGGPTEEVITVDAQSGGWSLVSGFEGRRWWWTSQSTGRIYVWNPVAGWYSTAFDLGLARGATFRVSIESAACLDGSTWKIGENSATIQTAVGTFAHSVVIVFTSGVCADAGYTKLVFCPSVGLVEFERTSIAGPVKGRLVRATVGGVQYAPPPPPAPGTITIPPRPAGSATGSEFVKRIFNLSHTAREQPVLAEILAGNVPDFLRTFQSVHLEWNGHRVEFRVMPDYLAIGSNADHVRIPMGSRAAQRVADAFGMALPTRKMVDAIYAQATVRLAPRPMTPTSAMISVDYFTRHNATIQGQLAGRPPGDLIAGHKKDVVISKLLATRPDRVAIYGWHTAVGKPIQPLSTVHEHSYADYSHGIRLVDRTVIVDGRARDYADVLADPALAGLLSDEGTISARIPTP